MTRSPRLARTLVANAASCLAFGIAFIVWPEPVAEGLGEAPPAPLRAVGAALLVNGLHLLASSRRPRPRRAEILYFSAGDVGWFLATLALAGSGIWLTRPAGIVAALAVGIGVAAMGVAQVYFLADSEGLGRSGDIGSKDALPGEYSRLAAIGASWLAMKTWVKVWLFALNGVFLGGLAFWPEPAARLALAGYLASGPLLFATASYQRGLTRALGWAHLAPWTPLALYLAVRLTSGAAGARIDFADEPGLFVWAAMLLAALAVCLGLDAWDAARWLRGERYRLGSAAAAEAGASKLARPAPASRRIGLASIPS